MADTPSPRPPDAAGGQSTRQLLEELDTLMQRMLELPVEQDEEVTAPPAAAPAKSVPAPEVAPRSVRLMHVPITRVTVQAPVAEQTVQDVAAATAQAPPLPKPEPKPRPQREEKPDSGAAPTYVPVGAEPLLPILLKHPAKIEQKKAPAADLPPVGLGTKPARKESPPPANPSWMMPHSTSTAAPVQQSGVLLAINRAYDLVTVPLGPVGCWFRGEQGRTLVGWSGLALIAAALIWAALLFMS